MTNDDKNRLKIEIDYIFETGANEIRIYEMIVKFIEKRYNNENNIDKKIKKLQDKKIVTPEKGLFGEELHKEIDDEIKLLELCKKQ